MTNSGDDANSRKCFSSILSRLLCSGSLPTHPSEQLVESSIEKFDYQKPQKSLRTEDNIKQVAAAESTPGIVARLMGLESFPTTPKDRTLGDFFRSKSVNSIDFLSHLDPIKHHRRVRTSVSFREGINDDVTSVILRLDEVNEAGKNEENEEFFIMKRPNVKYKYQQGRKEKETGRSNGEISQEREIFNRPGKNLEIEKQRKPVSSKFCRVPGPGNSASEKKDFQGKKRVNMKERRPIIKAVNCKEELMRSKCVKKKKSKILSHNVQCLKKIRPECITPEVATEINSSQTANSQSPYSRINAQYSDNIEVRPIITGENERKMKIKESCYYYNRMVEEICMLTEEDVKQNWIDNGMVLKFEDFEEICQQFGQEILEVLLKQFVDELVLLFGTRNYK